MELQALLEKAEPILRQAGELVRSIPHPAVYSKEGHANFVTEADMASQQFLMERLSPCCRRPASSPRSRRKTRWPPALTG